MLAVGGQESSTEDHERLGAHPGRPCTACRGPQPHQLDVPPTQLRVDLHRHAACDVDRSSFSPSHAKHSVALNGASAVGDQHNIHWRGYPSGSLCMMRSTSGQSCKIEEAHFAQYWTRGLAGGPRWMPALLATTHWDGMPRLLSVARFTSLYSSAPAQHTHEPLQAMYITPRQACRCWGMV